MAGDQPEDHVATFTEDALRIGLMLSGPAADLIEALTASIIRARHLGRS